MTHEIYVYMAVMSAVTIAIRVLPLTLIRKQVKSPFIKSFLFYVPYVTLAVMTVPAIFADAGTPTVGAIALLGGIALAWHGASMFRVAAACSVLAFAASQLL